MQKGNLDLLCATAQMADTIISKVNVQLPVDPEIKDAAVQGLMSMAIDVWQGLWKAGCLIATVTKDVPVVTCDSVPALTPPVSSSAPPAMQPLNPGSILGQVLGGAASAALGTVK